MGNDRNERIEKECEEYIEVPRYTRSGKLVYDRYYRVYSDAEIESGVKSDAAVYESRKFSAKKKLKNQEQKGKGRKQIENDFVEVKEFAEEMGLKEFYACELLKRPDFPLKVMNIGKKLLLSREAYKDYHDEIMLQNGLNKFV